MFSFNRKPIGYMNVFQTKINKLVKEIVFNTHHIGSEYLYKRPALEFLRRCDCHTAAILPGQYIDMAEQQPEPVDFCRN